VRERKPEQLRRCMDEARSSGIAELKSFVGGIERDYDAVKAALRLPWSQGITEGKVNILKTLKRQMYGRAGFALLRQRLLHDAYALLHEHEQGPYRICPSAHQKPGRPNYSLALTFVLLRFLEEEVPCRVVLSKCRILPSSLKKESLKKKYLFS